MEEMPIEDKCLTITTHNEGTNIFVINQASSRVVRQEIAKEMTNYIEALRGVDLSEFNDALENEAERFENKFIQLFSSEENKAPKVPVFDFSPVL